MTLKAIKNYTNEDGDELVELYEQNGKYEMAFYGYQLGPMRVTLSADTDPDTLAATIIASKPARKAMREMTDAERIANAERVTGLTVY